MIILDFIIGILATWRISNMFVNERGPYAVFLNMREWLGILYDDDGNKIGVVEDIQGIKKELALLVDCIWCLSFWIAIGLTIIYLVWPGIVLFLLPFALSAGAIVMDKLNNE